MSKESEEKGYGAQFTVRPKFTADSVLPLSELSDPPIVKTQKIICIGASTGGTRALNALLPQFPVDCPPIAIVLHMPEGFTNDFASRLSAKSKIKVQEARDGDKLEHGLALIAPGNKHMILRRSNDSYYVELNDGELVCRQRPSADVLFRSAARFAGPNAIGIIMTGMGDDGARGMLEMHERGAWTIAQNEETCAVYGMPKQAVALGGVDKILPLEQIALAALAKANQLKS